MTEKRNKAEAGAEGEPQAKKAKGLQKSLKITPELAEFLGTTDVTRPQLTKLFWAYFKDNSLIDPENKKFVKCDDKLKKITGQDRFQAFGFQKHISHHIIKD